MSFSQSQPLSEELFTVRSHLAKANVKENFFFDLCRCSMWLANYIYLRIHLESISLSLLLYSSINEPLRWSLLVLRCNNVHRYYVHSLERKSLLQTHITLTHVSLLLTECVQLPESIHQLHISVCIFLSGEGASSGIHVTMLKVWATDLVNFVPHETEYSLH